MPIQICHLYPDVLNLYGDQGNLTCLKKRLEWRKIEYSVTELPAGIRTDLTKFDLLIAGGGLLSGLEIVLEDLQSGKRDDLRDAVSAGVPVLAVCEGMEFFGSTLRRTDGVLLPCAGAVPFHVELSAERLVGNYAFRVPGLESPVCAFENHTGRLYLEDCPPLGEIVKGHGNNDADHTEGVHWKNFFGSYGHGPLLPKNPALADLILQAVIAHADSGYSLESLPDQLEKSAYTYMADRLEVF